jgi:hypothetical protein
MVLHAQIVAAPSSRIDRAGGAFTGCSDPFARAREATGAPRRPQKQASKSGGIRETTDETHTHTGGRRGGGAARERLRGGLFDHDPERERARHHQHDYLYDLDQHDYGCQATGEAQAQASRAREGAYGEQSHRDRGDHAHVNDASSPGDHEHDDHARRASADDDHARRTAAADDDARGTAADDDHTHERVLGHRLHPPERRWRR